MKKVVIFLVILFVVGILLVLGINIYVVLSTKNQIIDIEELKKEENIDCIIVLGAGIWGDEPSPMLEDRLLEGINLYENGVASKIIMSGDHGREDYDEVNIMKDFAINRGIPSEDIFMDHAGFATYDSIYRAKEIFEAKRVVIVTQDYHLYRALHIANSLGIEAYGVPSNPRKYGGQFIRDIREILARDKDFIKCLFKPKPTYLGESIPVSGNGDITNDKEREGS
ncbi:MAG TPA: SanA protein [Firmicutes bacterium]|nr:SanA protein [Bacillota bacterium]